MKTITMPQRLVEPLKRKDEEFKKVGTLVDLVISGAAPALLLTGQAGVGKTKVVLSRLEAANKLEGFGYEMVKGHGSALGLYSVLHRCRKQLVIFDDADSIFQDERSANLLKAALDSYSRRVISWESSSVKAMDLPMSFSYEGQIIFISNINKSKMDKAVLTRCFTHNLELSPEEVLAFMYSIINLIEPAADQDVKREVLEFIENNRDSLWDKGMFNLRTLINGIRLRSFTSAGWQELFLRSCS